MNWWLDRNLKVMLDVSRTGFEGGSAAGPDREDEELLLGRFQISF